MNVSFTHRSYVYIISRVNIASSLGLTPEGGMGGGAHQKMLCLDIVVISNVVSDMMENVIILQILETISQ